MEIGPFAAMVVDEVHRPVYTVKLCVLDFVFKCTVHVLYSTGVTYSRAQEVYCTATIIT